MILPLLEKLSTCRIILASGSPRRKDILESVGIKFSVVTSTFEENLEPSMFPTLNEFVLETASQKAYEVADRIIKSGDNFELLIAADTIVEFQGKVYGKPGTPEKAEEMLKILHGATHRVITGVVLIWNGYSPDMDSKGFIEKFSEMTDVKLASLSEKMMTSYVKTGEPLDKAGAYAIQGIGGSFVEKIVGDYYNVVGFPLHRFCVHVDNHYQNITQK